MTTVVRSLWRQPRPAGVPDVGRLDLLLAGAYAVAAVVEGIVRPGLVGRPWVTVLALTMVPALIWRRQHPLLATVVGWGAAALLSAVQLATDAEDLGLFSMMAVLVLLYTLVRWGAGREIVVGASVVAAVVALGMYASAAGWADLFGGTVLLLLVVALGAAFRYRTALWQRQQIEVRNEERVALARELHDTVAHHVSAIAVQAQAGGVVAHQHPDRAAEVLAAIESEASRTLAEMRAMVSVLRDGDAVTYSPVRGVADLPSLARSDSTPDVTVAIDDALAGLPRSVDTALYRLGQESLTNALRHARDATHVEIDVRREGSTVVLRVSDDGRSERGVTLEPGFGLRGMAERAHLLGGSFCAGPAADGGWVVEAALPMTGPTEGPA